VSQLAPELRELDYDAYRDIRFRPDHALWRAEKLPFELMSSRRARLSGCRAHQHGRAGGVKRLEFDPRCSDFGRTSSTRQAAHARLCGFSRPLPAECANYKDELVVFLGASYFRAIGQGPDLRALGTRLGSDTAAPSGEEFPRFTESGSSARKLGATSLTIYGLLDSPRVVGAYKFIVTPQGNDDAGRRSVVCPRRRAEGGQVRLCPVNTMFSSARTSRPGRLPPEFMTPTAVDPGCERRMDLASACQSETLLVTSFLDHDPRGFGLMQRDRAEQLRDPEALYERRPSLWVEPVGRGAAGVSSWCKYRRPTRPTTTSSRTGCPTSRRSRTSRSTSPTACTGKA
jgi:glucans biosynthesis protein